MDFERLFLTSNSEFYRFSLDYEDVAYLLFFDTFSKADKDFGKRFCDEDYETRQNYILVKVGLRRELEDEEREQILSFVEGMLGFKPDVDYFVDFIEVAKDIEFDYPTDSGFFELVAKVNDIFGLDNSVEISDALSFNHIIQH
jgi:hypothetical protein